MYLAIADDVVDWYEIIGIGCNDQLRILGDILQSRTNIYGIKHRCIVDAIIVKIVAACVVPSLHD